MGKNSDRAEGFAGVLPEAPELALTENPTNSSTKPPLVVQVEGSGPHKPFGRWCSVIEDARVDPF